MAVVNEESQGSLVSRIKIQRIGTKRIYKQIRNDLAAVLALKYQMLQRINIRRKSRLTESFMTFSEYLSLKVYRINNTIQIYYT